MISRLGVLSVLALIIGALNLGAMLNWNVPYIGIEKAYASGTCIHNALVCCPRGPGNCSYYDDCRDAYVWGYVGCTCNGGRSC